MQPLLQCKTVSITQTVCVFVALGIRHAMSMPHAVICGLPGSTIFSTLSHESSKTLMNIKCVFRVSTQLLSEIFFILRRSEQDMIKNIQCSSCKVLFFLSDFKET